MSSCSLQADQPAGLTLRLMHWMDATDAPVDLAVLARAREGDEAAFEALVVRHSRRAFLLAFRMSGNEQDAEDIVQESFLRAYRQLSRFQARADFGTWLYRIVANCAVDLLRARRSRPGPASPDRLDAWASTAVSATPAPDRLAASADIQRRVRAALDDLSPVERAAFSLRHAEGRSIKEIGRMLNLGVSATKHAVFRAVRKLRRRLGPVKSQLQ